MCASSTCSATERPDLASVAVIAETRNPGTNVRHSATQFGTTLVGATTRKRVSRLASTARATSARVCTVFPNPMSSARIPPSPFFHRNVNQFRPSCW
ncbi:hypothetical protein GORHZ_145_00010 [Gordonia rhizosphera NBRC 16068]|uniref:Uncharacterized protein n=1 Tax=Gordonia rhizosphera NBRC 16068 TaxID=1108045 RepID=K6WDD9_9ACTN|nr:hypothetical protein GORHZ_145_00010 [Gordonia rhizosphera NBRC 16068]